jgi:hypothetical protein
MAVAADGGGQVAPQRQAVLDHPVAVVEELDLVHADDGAAGPLLGLAHHRGLGRVHAVDARLAPGHQQVGDVLALVGPAGDRGRTPVLHVVGVGHDHERPPPVLGHLLQRRGRGLVGRRHIGGS